MRRSPIVPIGRDPRRVKASRRSASYAAKVRPYGCRMASISSGAADALRDVSRQLIRNRGAFGARPQDMPVFGLSAATFNDNGVTALYQHLAGLLAAPGLPLAEGMLPAASGRISTDAASVIPPARTGYLAEIAGTVVQPADDGRHPGVVHRQPGPQLLLGVDLRLPHRVARRIWAVAMRERYGASERSQKLKYHVQTSGRSLHAQEMAFNDIRTTLQALCAIYDNCNSLHTNAYDEAVTTPSEESVRRALAIQLVINRE
jgi:Methylmalonyl-CoA mutase